mgnify:CR=1 FL=1
MVRNRDWENWTDRMATFGEAPSDLAREVTPRPGHADLVGRSKPTRPTAATSSSAQAPARRLRAWRRPASRASSLADLGVEVFSYVTSIGSASFKEDDALMNAPDYKPLAIETSEVRCPDEQATEAMKAEIDRAKDAGESLGGTFRVVVTGLVPGVGGYASAGDRLTSRLGAALFSIPAIKGVEFGMGFEAARKPGSPSARPILLDRAKAEFTRASNNAGGLEGGMTTGMPLVVTAAMKPIPTLMQPLRTVNLDTLEVAQASKERSDVCAVPACAVVAEGEVAFAIADAYMRKFGSDNMADIKAAIKAYKQRLNTVSR